MTRIFLIGAILISELCSCTPKSKNQNNNSLSIVAGLYYIKALSRDTMFLRIYADTVYCQSFRLSELDSIKTKNGIIVDKGLKEIGFENFFDPLDSHQSYFGGFVFADSNYMSLSGNSSYHIYKLPSK